MVAEADKGKKQKIDTDEDSDRVLLSVDKIQDLQDQLEKINEEASDQVFAIEKKYNTKRKPVYEKRDEAISTIPDFWLTALLCHPVLGDLLNDEDQKIFKYLSSLEVDDFIDGKMAYSITFVFKPNPYFEDTKLTKTFTFSHDPEGTLKVTATKIKWKDGMGIPNAVADENKGSKRAPPAHESFFTWFSESELQSDINDIHDEVADIIKDELWANPLTYFNGDSVEDLDGEECDEEEDGEEDGTDSSDEEDGSGDE